MFETSKDILFIVLAFCAVGFTIFVCFALYHWIRIMRDVKKKLKMLTSVIEFFSNEMVTKAAQKVFSFLMTKGAAKVKKAKAKKKK